jgi:pilus assembly protein FimV
MADFGRYRASLAAAAAQRQAAVAAADRTAGGRIETQPEQAAPPGPKDQVKLSKVDPKQTSTAASRAARDDDMAARERALQEAQSRVSDLEKNVADLRKLLELKNQQLAELEKRAAAKGSEAPKPAPAPAPVAKAVQAAKPAAAAPAEAPKVAIATQPPAPQPPAAPPKPAAEPAKAAAAAPKAAETVAPPAATAKAPEAPKPAAVQAPKAPEAPKAAEAPKAKPAPKPAPVQPPPPEPSFVDEFLDNPVALGGLGLVFVMLAGYGAWAWRRKKAAQVKFQDSVLGPASTAGASSVFGPAQKAAAGPSSVVLPSVSQASVGGMETDEVDPIAEADVYMAYGRDAQAEEILREALEKDASRTTIHEKLLEIYANRRDPKAFEQIALKLKEITGGAGPEWDKAVALGRSVDPQNSLYGGTGRAAAAAPAVASGLDFDLNAAPAQGGAPDLVLGGPGQDSGMATGSVDIDLGAAEAAQPAAAATDFTPEGTLIIESGQAEAATGGLDFDLGTAEAPKAASAGIDFELPSSAPALEPAASAGADSGGGIDFDLQLDLGETKTEVASAPATAAAPLDLSSISLDLGAVPEASGAPASTDPKWQEVATKLDLAKAYEEMGDKSGASELLNEVLREGDGAQRTQAQELLAKLA